MVVELRFKRKGKCPHQVYTHLWEVLLKKKASTNGNKKRQNAIEKKNFAQMNNTKGTLRQR